MTLGDRAGTFWLVPIQHLNGFIGMFADAFFRAEDGAFFGVLVMTDEARAFLLLKNKNEFLK